MQRDLMAMTDAELEEEIKAAVEQRHAAEYCDDHSAYRAQWEGANRRLAEARFEKSRRSAAAPTAATAG